MMADYCFVTDPPESYLCQICMKVLREPHATECCGQHYCRACLEEWFAQNKGKRVCPHCRERNFQHILYKPLKRKIDELEVYCINCDKGCQKTPKLSDLEVHLKSFGKEGCDYISVVCPNACGVSVVRINLESHLNYECIKRKAKCLYCAHIMPHDLIDEHVKCCNKRPVKCPRDCGIKSLRSGDLKKHKETCPNVKVKCLFYNTGCNGKLLRKDYGKHMDEKTADHLAMVYASWKADIDRLKTENIILREGFCQSYEALESETARLRADYETLKADYETLKAGIPSKRARDSCKFSDPKPTEACFKALDPLRDQESPKQAFLWKQNGVSLREKRSKRKLRITQEEE